jgi:hypothetical protein
MIAAEENMMRRRVTMMENWRLESATLWASLRVMVCAYICPSTHHPSPVLIDLKQLDVDVSQCERDSGRDD